MTTENENWNVDSGNEYRENNREGNQYNNREGRYSRPSYNNREGRPYRPRINADGNDRPQRNYGEQRSYRPRFNGNNEGYRPRYNNNEEGERSYGSSERPFRPRYNNNNEGYRPRYNNNNSEEGEQTYGSSERPFRPRYNNNNNRGGYNNNRRPSRPRTADYNPNAKYSKKKQIEYKEQFVDPNEPIRLNKYLANAGVCSRREADEYIQAGVVSVNGEVVTELGTKIKRGDEVKFHDQTVSIERKIYVLLNKPKDTVTTSDDPQARRTVLDLV